MQTYNEESKSPIFISKYARPIKTQIKQLQPGNSDNDRKKIDQKGAQQKSEK